MNIYSLLLGLLIGATAAFGTGFLKKAGEDLYVWLKIKINPQSAAKQHLPVIVKLEPDSSLAISSSEGRDEASHQHSAITFDAIEKAIEAAPLLQQENVAASYKGIRINWMSYLRSAWKVDDGKIRLALSVDNPTRGRYIICEVPENDNRELGILQKGTPIRVSGVIAEAKTYEIKLTEAKIKILSNQSS